MGTVVTATGDAVTTARLIGATPIQAEPKNACWGTGGVAGGPFAAAKSDVGMFSESAEARVAGTSSQTTTATTSDTYQVVATLTSASSQTITEWGLFDSTTKPPATTVTGGTVVGSSTGTTLQVASATGFPTSGTFSVQVRTEVMTVTAGQGTTTWTVTRGANGSTAIASIAAADIVVGGNPPGSAAVTGGTQYVHASFAGLALSPGDSITGTVQIRYN